MLDWLQDNKPIPRAHTLSKFDVELDSYSGLIVIRGRVKKNRGTSAETTNRDVTQVKRHKTASVH